MSAATFYIIKVSGRVNLVGTNGVSPQYVCSDVLHHKGEWTS